jgi:uncharacterized repeat protein (TIGR01451 family)
VSVGGNITYTLTVHNAGPSPAAGVMLTDSLPAGLSLVSASSTNGTCSGTRTVTCDLGTVNAGAENDVSVMIVATAGRSAAPSITNTATVSSATADPSSANNQASAQTISTSPPLSVPPPPSPLADKVTSFASLKCASTQRAGGLVVQASMPENGTITVGGSVNVPNAARVFRLKAVSVNATAGRTVKITVKLAAKTLKAVKKALKRHKKVRANLTITARDGAGNVKGEKRAVKLKG